VNEVQVATDRPGYEPVSSTLWRQREEYCARLIQNAWRRHKNSKGEGGGSEVHKKGGDDDDVTKAEVHEENASAPDKEGDVEQEECLIVTVDHEGSPSNTLSVQDHHEISVTKA